jgi:F0F1-type ATP synthase membrane subunit b/b'
MTEKPKGTEDLLGQFRELGLQLEKSIRKAWESNQGQEVREEIGKGLKELETQLGKVVDDARKNQTVQGIEKQVKSGVQTVTSEETTSKISQEIKEALKALNDQLNKLIRAVPGPQNK